MTIESNELVTCLSQGNSVDLEKLAFVEQQFQQLERAGIVSRTGYAIERPLGRLTQTGSMQTLANVGGLTQR
jgi:hypothetical protein